MGKIYFISDVHLGFFERTIDKKREDLLLACLNNIKSDCDRLIIVGDFFDYWFEWKYAIPRYFYRTLALLADFRASNIKIHYMMGNHDFGHVNFFRDELGIEINRDTAEYEFFGKRFFIFHGDGLAYKDGPYRLLKKILRNRFNLKLYTHLLHPDCAIKFASNTSNKSRKYTSSQKKYGEKDGMKDFAEAKIAEGFDYVIMGHRHKLESVQFAGGTYINLGDWFKTPGLWAFDENGFEFLQAEKLAE